MAAGLLGASMAQPIDDCLIVLGRLMFAGPLQSAVMTSSWQPTDLLGKSGGGEAKNVLQSILQVMGLTVAEVNDADTLSRLGIDSMQLVEVPPPSPPPYYSPSLHAVSPERLLSLVICWSFQRQSALFLPSSKETSSGSSAIM